MKPAAAWVFALEQSLHVVEYLVIIWPGGLVELEDTWSLRCFHPAVVDVPLADRASWYHEIFVDDRENAEVICRYTWKIRLEASLIKLILRANHRGIYRDDTDDPGWGKTRNFLATSINQRLEERYWTQWLRFMIVIPEQRLNEFSPQIRAIPEEAQLNLCSQAGSLQKRF